MDWLANLFTQTDSVGHIVIIYAVVISVGLLLGRIKVAGISLGVTFVLFAGILLGHIYHSVGITSSVGGFAAPGNILTFNLIRTRLFDGLLLFVLRLLNRRVRVLLNGVICLFVEKSISGPLALKRGLTADLYLLASKC